MATNTTKKPLEDATSAIAYGERLLAADVRRNARNMGRQKGYRPDLPCLARAANSFHS